MPEILTAAHIAAAAGGFEPQRQSNFRVRLTPPAGDGNLMEMAVRQTSLPNSETSVETVPFVNEERKYAGRTTFPNQTLILNDYVEEDVAAQMEAWRKLVFDPENGKVGMASEYKSQGTLILFGPGGGQTRKWKLIGLWPSGLNMGDANMENATQVQLSSTMVVDIIQRQ